MSHDDLKRTLENAFPDTPDIFHQRLLEAGEKARPRGLRARRAPRLAILAALALMMCGSALAVMNHYGVLNFHAGWQDDYYFTLPGAEKMIQYDLAKATTGELNWQVKEAAYDGRVLRILYAVRHPSFGQHDGWEEDYGHLGSNFGVCLQCDGTGEIFVNGQGVNLQNVDFRQGEAPDEIEGWMDCRMEGYETDGYIKPEGKITVSMPFSFKNEEAKASASAPGLTFTLDVGDAASRYALALPDPFTLENGSVVTFTDLHFSPVTVFMDLEITLPADREIHLPENGEEGDWGMLAAFPEYRALMDCRMENGRGEPLGVWKDGASWEEINGEGCAVLHAHCEFAPSDKYTDVNYLCLGERWKVPIQMKYEK